MQIIIKHDGDGSTVKDYLYGNLGYSSNLIKELKKIPDGITVNGQHVTVRYVLKSGDKLNLSTDDTFDSASDSVVPVKLPLDIIFEDEYIIALNKPAGMPTHPSHNHHNDTLANSLAYYFDSQNRPFVFRAINRLDADTSGIVLVAKDKDTAFKLSKSMAEGKIQKKYVALLYGVLNGSGKIDLPIRRSETSTMLRVVDMSPNADTKHALTTYDTICTSDKYTLVSASPVTGRTHQLRVHFSHIGNPICGDGLYGITTDGSDYPRLALHAYYLSFPHPNGDKTVLTAPIPECFYLDFNSSIINNLTER